MSHIPAWQALAKIGIALLGKPTGQAILYVNQGGLTNRDAPSWAKELFTTDVCPWLVSNNRPRTEVTGTMHCNLIDGQVGNITLPRWKRLKEGRYILK